jgi:hypothetical protein
MSRSTRSDPDCSGRWRCGITLGVAAIASSTSGVKSRGCGEVKRTRSSPSTSPSARSRSANSARPSEVAPVRVDVLSEQRDLDDVVGDERWTSARTSATVRDRSGPRSAGTMQNEHVLSQPTEMETQA